MSLYFDQINIAVNGTGVICDSCSIDSQNVIQPLYVLGQRSIIGQNQAGGIKHSCQISYLVDLLAEPLQLTSSNLKTIHNSFSYDALTIELAGITGSFYLESYNVKIDPNQEAKATASLISYLPLTGAFTNTGTTVYNTTSSSGLAHAWQTFVSNVSNYSTIPTYSFDYSFKAKWSPIYVIGNPNPIQTQLLGGDETFTFVRDQFDNIQFSGETAQTFLNLSNTTTILLNNISQAPNSVFSTLPLYSLTFDCGSGIVTNNNISAVTDDMIKVKTQIVNYF